MGGELIASIIEAAPHLKSGGVRLILQPMTKQAHLRRYLFSHGFTVLSERYTCAEGKYYVTLMAEYTGECLDIDSATAEIGIDMPHDSDRVEYLGYLKARRNAYIKVKEGREKGGLDFSDEERILLLISQKISESER